ncbi:MULTISPECIES: ROK family transcriptional regulator [Brevibacterium]|uniref:ROK family transcriptional regulator n=3 Tax=Brevibacterium casei TaxID=33889 RepID=K9AKZ4_9MICO|nr:ROK family transcriptional regulator [Brevibacterium casei]EKU46741.1 ROK family transcriptional regulator [Brevibacterium casei S18]MCT1551595.1 ROK family transcriptional regulator [Brevibacterium casei]MCT1561535.1 ROK family transcriptional regulator [Brevibacterium casei]MCT2208834.1 ROK family transcriptional regulator [Brevibacterium casei]QPS34141.1 ROK family transcriptional regulator [Brevibacterium casei]
MPADHETREPLIGLKQRNTGLILRHLLHNPGLSRSEVAKSVGLSAPTVTNLTGELIDHGFLRGLVSKSGSMGRPRVPLAVDPDRRAVLGIHLGPQVTGLTIMGLDGTEKVSELVPHGDLPGPEAIAKVVTAAERLTADREPGELLGTGIATGGQVDVGEGVVLDHPSAGWRDLDAISPFRAALSGPIVFDHNVRAAAQWELLYGVGRVTDDFLLLVVASDVGCISVRQGAIRHGASRRAGIISHLTVPGSTVVCECGRTGCFAAAASDDALVRQAHTAGLTDISYLDLLVRLADTGDATASALLSERNRAISCTAAALFDLDDPGRLVIAGSPAEVADHFEEIRTGVGRESVLGEAASERVVVSNGHLMSLTHYAASSMVAKVLEDPLAHVSGDARLGA